jgi:hypothetical protein
MEGEKTLTKINKQISWNEQEDELEHLAGREAVSPSAGACELILVCL